MPRSLTWLRFQLITAILQLKDEAYTNELRRLLNATHRSSYELGAIHTTLDRMREAGLLRTYVRDGVVANDGRTRSVTVYELTELGEKTYEASKAFHV